MFPAPYLVTLGLFFGALLLAVTSGLALAAVARGLGTMGRWLVQMVAKAVVLWPLSALIWAAIGCWVGQLGLPILSLMPAVEAEGVGEMPMQMAQVIWWWAPPVFLLALPMSAQVLVSALGSRKLWYAQVRQVGLLGIVLIPVVEEAFHLPGALAGLVSALQMPDTPSLLLVLAPLAGLMAGWWCLASAWPHSPTPYPAGADDLVREGALAIGLSPHAVWKRHLRRNQMRRGLAWVCSALAMILSLWVAYGWPGLAVMGAAWQDALQQALTNSLAPLQASLRYALCALSLWLLGRMILPHQR